MPFIAECTFCGGKVRVPDGSLGLSLACPRCGNYFTLAPAAEQPAPLPGELRARPPKPPSTPLADLPRPPVPAVRAARLTDPPGRPPTPEEYVKPVLQADQLGPLIPGAPGAEEPAGTRRIQPWGAVALFLGCVALPAAQLGWLRYLAVPLAVGGVLVGVVGLLAAADGPRRRLFWPAGGTAVSLIALVVILVFPGLLAIDSRPPQNDTENARFEVPFGKGEGREVGDADWVDASRFSVQHGPVRVRVTSAEVRRREKKVVIGLRLIQAQGASRIVYQGWGPRAGADEAGGPRLEDDRGRTYAPAGAGPAGPARAAVLLPGKPVRDTLRFEAQPGSVGFFRLELPASAFGKAGRLRLQIPGSMIRQRP